MKVLIIGIGSIARKHIMVLRELCPDVEIFAVRSSVNSAELPGIYSLYNWDDLSDYDFHFAIVSSPSSLHLKHVKILNHLNIPLMIEKPLVINREQLKEFENIQFRNKIVYIACNMRFHPLVTYVKDYLESIPGKVNEVNVYFGSYLPDWRAGADYTKVYSALAALGGGVHLDLIHEPDYVVYLFGLPESSRTVKRRVSELDIDSCDSSNTLFQYPGFQAQIVVNYFRRDARRILEIVREKDTILVDFISNTISQFPSDTILFQVDEPSVYTTYKKQMAYFLECIEANRVPMNSPPEAIEILKLII
jgi:predicted dehydrogenase